MLTGFASSFSVLPDRPMQLTLEHRSRSTPTEPTTTSSTRLTRSSFGGSQAGGLAFSICISDVIVLAFSKAKPD